MALTASDHNLVVEVEGALTGVLNSPARVFALRFFVHHVLWPTRTLRPELVTPGIVRCFVPYEGQQYKARGRRPKRPVNLDHRVITAGFGLELWPLGYDVQVEKIVDKGVYILVQPKKTKEEKNR